MAGWQDRLDDEYQGPREQLRVPAPLPLWPERAARHHPRGTAGAEGEPAEAGLPEDDEGDKGDEVSGATQKTNNFLRHLKQYSVPLYLRE